MLPRYYEKKKKKKKERKASKKTCQIYQHALVCS